MGEEEEKGFTVKDRRHFSQEDSQEAKKEKKEAPEIKESPRTEKPVSKEQETEPQLPEINFNTFIFSLNASALVQLGLMEDPATGRKEKNLAVAKQTIDMLSMLQEKTAGNLTKEEEDMLKNILYDLRIRYVKERR